MASGFSLEEADAWLSTGFSTEGLTKRSVDDGSSYQGSTRNRGDSYASSLAMPTPSSTAALDLGTPASLFDRKPLASATGISLETAGTRERAPTIDEDLPKPVKYDYSKEDFPMPEFQNIEVSQYKAPSPTEHQIRKTGNTYYTKDSEPSGKLDLFKQDTWLWPPSGGASSHDPDAPELYRGAAEARNLDSVATIAEVNKESLAKIEKTAEEGEQSALETLNQEAADQVAFVDMTASEYKGKLQCLGELRKALLSTVQKQVDKQRHQWGVKTKFYEADVESKRIFEEVQQRITHETQRRMDEAKKEVAEQLSLHAQALMEAKKCEVLDRVETVFDQARTKAKDESAQLFVLQSTQRDALRTEFVARMQDHTKKFQAQEYQEAVNKAKSINIRINLDEEFEQYCAERKL